MADSMGSAQSVLAEQADIVLFCDIALVGMLEEVPGSNHKQGQSF
jgi:hypothetical protein